MKLATYKDETRDGCLMVVSKDLSRACSAQDIAKTMQDALDNWKEVAPQLQMKYQALNEQSCESVTFDELSRDGADARVHARDAD